MLQKHRVLCGFFTDLLVCFLPLRASVSAVSMWRARPVTDVNLCTGTSPLTLLMDAPVRNTTHTHTDLTCFTSFTAVNGAHK